MVIRPLRRHRVHTTIRLTPLAVAARTSCRLGCHRRLVLLLAWLTLLPTEGRFPQIAQCRIYWSALLKWIHHHIRLRCAIKVLRVAGG